MRTINNKMILVATMVLLSAGSLLSLTGCGTANGEEPKTAADTGKTEEDRAVKAVRVVSATSGDVQEILLRATTISAPETVNLLPKVSGQIVYLNAEEGRHVKPGDVIAKLESTDYQLTADKARMLMEKARHDMNLAQKQLDAAVIGREEFLEAQHAFEQATLDHNRAVVDMEKTVITSPIEGVISQRLVSKGDTVFTSMPIVTITDTKKLEADILVPQTEIDRVMAGNEVVFYPNGDADRAFRGRVVRVSPVIETDSGTVKVTASIFGGQKNVMPGQFVKAMIITGVRENVTLVPRAAIVIENAMSVIYKVVDGFTRRIPVEVGYPNGQNVQVIGAVSAGEEVVVVGLNGLNDMTPVKVLPLLTE